MLRQLAYLVLRHQFHSYLRTETFSPLLATVVAGPGPCTPHTASAPPLRGYGDATVIPRRNCGESPMGIAAHGSLTGISPESRRNHTGGAGREFVMAGGQGWSIPALPAHPALHTVLQVTLLQVLHLQGVAAGGVLSLIASRSVCY